MSRKKIIAILRSNEAYDQFRQILSGEYDILEITDKEKAMELINNDSENIVGLIFDAGRAIEDGFSFTKDIDKDKRFVQITSIALSLNEDKEQIRKCIENGVSEYLVPPYDKDLVLLRVRNAIRSKDSTTFGEIENILKELPSNIYMKDTQARYVFSTHLWHHLNVGNEANWTIRGKTDLEIRKDKENAMKAYQSDLDIIKNDRGTSYIIEENDDGIKEYLELIKRPIHDENGNVTGIISLINDVTETQLLKQELEKQSSTDFLTAVMNRRACQECIERLLEINRKGTMMMVDVDNFKSINDTYGHDVGDEVLIELAGILKDSVRRDDLVGRMGGDEFLIFLSQNTDRNIAASMSERILKKIEDSFKNKKYADHISVSIGAVICNDEDLSFEDMYSLADKALYKVKNGGKGTYCIS